MEQYIPFMTIEAGRKTVLSVVSDTCSQLKWQLFFSIGWLYWGERNEIIWNWRLWINSDTEWLLLVSIGTCYGFLSFCVMQVMSASCNRDRWGYTISPSKYMASDERCDYYIQGTTRSKKIKNRPSVSLTENPRTEYCSFKYIITCRCNKNI